MIIKINDSGQIQFDQNNQVSYFDFDEYENNKQWASGECRTEQGSYFADQNLGLNPFVWKVSSSIFDKTFDIKRAIEKHTPLKNIKYENKVFEVQL